MVVQTPSHPVAGFSTGWKTQSNTPHKQCTTSNNASKHWKSHVNMLTDLATPFLFLSVIEDGSGWYCIKTYYIKHIRTRCHVCPSVYIYIYHHCYLYVPMLCQTSMTSMFKTTPSETRRLRWLAFPSFRDFPHKHKQSFPERTWFVLSTTRRL